MAKDHGTIYCPAPPLSDPESNFKGFNPGTTLLPRGYVHEEGALPLPCEIIMERDVAVTLRDGVKIYVDIFRPNTDEKVPALLNSSVFGKNGSYITLNLIAGWNNVPDRFGIPKGTLSELQTWEGADPAFWCNHGYAIVNMDLRGIGMSEGDAHYFGNQDAEDNYDVIEWLAVQDWCSGHVSMCGNSWLGITQWYVAAKRPPHLTCIAPWEGHGNMYVDEYMRGGITNWAAVRLKMGFGNQHTEDLPAEMEAYPLMNEFWEEKIAPFEDIVCPAYVVASWCSNIHCRGTFEAWQKMSSKEKWLRVHNTQEWPDFYDEYHSQDLLRFYDYYMKGKNNGWENTPKVRMSILDPGGRDSIDRIENEFPLARQQFEKLYLTPDMTLSHDKPAEHSTVVYCGDDEKGVARFKIRFDKETEISGFMKLKLWVEADGNDDMDIFASVCKMDAEGKYVYHNARLRLYNGPDERLRVSLRELDEEKSTPEQPVHTFKHPQKLAKGEIVPIEIGLWPTSLRFHAGEQVEIAISGMPYEMHLSDFPGKTLPTINKGSHIIHMGGEYDSHLLVPFIPEK